MDVEYFPEQPPRDAPFPRTVILTAGGGLSWSAR
jgi:hypothetical protein